MLTMAAVGRHEARPPPHVPRRARGPRRRAATPVPARAQATMSRWREVFYKTTRLPPSLIRHWCVHGSGPGAPPCASRRRPRGFASVCVGGLRRTRRRHVAGQRRAGYWPRGCRTGSGRIRGKSLADRTRPARWQRICAGPLRWWPIRTPISPPPSSSSSSLPPRARRDVLLRSPVQQPHWARRRPGWRCALYGTHAGRRAVARCALQDAIDCRLGRCWHCCAALHDGMEGGVAASAPRRPPVSADEAVRCGVAAARWRCAGDVGKMAPAAQCTAAVMRPQRPAATRAVKKRRRQRRRRGRRACTRLMQQRNQQRP